MEMVGMGHQAVVLLQLIKIMFMKKWYVARFQRISSVTRETAA